MTDRAPSFQFFPKDWLSDPAVQALTWDERGRYHHLLCLTLQTPTPGVMTEDEVRRYCCYSDEEWVAHRSAIQAAFKVRSDGKWVQKRTAKDSTERRRRYLKAKSGAEATNTSRWGGRSATRSPKKNPVATASHGVQQSDPGSGRSATRSAVAPAVKAVKGLNPPPDAGASTAPPGAASSAVAAQCQDPAGGGNAAQDNGNGLRLTGSERLRDEAEYQRALASRRLP